MDYDLLKDNKVIGTGKIGVAVNIINCDT